MTESQMRNINAPVSQIDLDILYNIPKEEAGGYICWVWKYSREGDEARDRGRLINSLTWARDACNAHKADEFKRNLEKVREREKEEKAKEEEKRKDTERRAEARRLRHAQQEEEEKKVRKQMEEEDRKRREERGHRDRDYRGRGEESGGRDRG